VVSRPGRPLRGRTHLCVGQSALAAGANSTLEGGSLYESSTLSPFFHKLTEFVYLYPLGRQHSQSMLLHVCVDLSGGIFLEKS